MLGLVLAASAWRALRGSARAVAAPPAGAVSYRPPLDEAAARRLFGLDRRRSVRYDPLALLVHVPGSSERWTWPEHPNGGFVRRVNALGLNEDEPTLVEKRGLRVLVAGDSHTAGLVDDADSFCNVAERALRSTRGRSGADVLNAGVGYTSPTCYLGMLHKHLALAPDVFVAVVFTGNDFVEETALGYAAGRWPEPRVPAAYVERLEAVAARDSAPLWQGLNQPYRWKSFPGELERGLAWAAEACLEMQRVCAARGIRFLVVLLPTKMDVDADDREVWIGAARRLGLAPEDVALDLEVGRRLLARLGAAGIECLDPTDEMRRVGAPLYWRTDYHLGLRGHAVLGELLAAALAAPP